MRPALRLQAYLAYTKGKAEGYRAPDFPQTASGPVVLGVAASSADAVMLERLAERLSNIASDATLVLTGAVGSAGSSYLDLPADNERDALAFAKFLRPAVVLWTGNKLRPALLKALKSIGSWIVHINAGDTTFETDAPKWLPDPAIATLNYFDQIFLQSKPLQRKFVRLGVPQTRLQHIGPVFDPGLALDCPDAMHEEAVGLFAARPLWLAARVHHQEARQVLKAHQEAMRFAPRLLLVLVPADSEDHREIAEQVKDMGLICCMWDDGYMPDQNSQVILTEGPEDLGLWYRLAPFAFLGGTLAPDLPDQDPFEAAALGSAVLYGPYVGSHAQAFTRMVQAGAARIVHGSESLTTAVGRLMAPDMAASMAHAGWEVVSEGAEAVDRILDDIATALDRAEVSS